MSTNDPVPSGSTDFKLSERFPEHGVGDAELKLVELPHEEKSATPLPLPDQDREEMQNRMQRIRSRRFSLTELFGLTILFSIILGLATLIPLELLSLVLGILTIAGLVITKVCGWSERITWQVFGAMYFAYVVSIVFLLIRG